MITLHKKKAAGRITIPASKSQTIRAFLIATFSREKSVILNPLHSSDTAACIEACRELGAVITFNEDGSKAYVDATALDIKDRIIDINTENSGTTTYLIYGLLATLGAKRITLQGDEQLNKRPILPLVNAYRDLGVTAEIDGNTPPVALTGMLKGGHTSIECKTSQYLSSLLLALPLAENDSIVDCPLLFEKPYVRMTLDWLDRQHIEYTISDDLQHSEIKGGQVYHGGEFLVPGDFSSAAFFFAIAAVCGTTITVDGLDKNDSQGDKHFLDILEDMGCEVSWEGYSVTVKGPEQLKGINIDLNSMPDILPILSVVAARSRETTIIHNVAQARIKETDRISCMKENLQLLGADAEEREDGLIIHGKGSLRGGFVKGYGDHRIIMAMAVASLLCEKEMTIDDESACSVTFPAFFELFRRL